MLTLDTKFAQVAAQMIAERVDGISEEIASGQLQDYAAYLRHTGRIAGLREAIEIFEEAEKQLKER